MRTCRSDNYPLPACQTVLRELLAHRATRSALVQTGRHSKALARLDEPVLAALQQAIKHVDEQLSRALQADVATRQAYDHITAVPGLGLDCG